MRYSEEIPTDLPQPCVIPLLKFQIQECIKTGVLLKCISQAGILYMLFTTYMYRSLGIHGASTLTAFLALVYTPIPFVL